MFFIHQWKISHRCVFPETKVKLLSQDGKSQGGLKDWLKYLCWLNQYAVDTYRKKLCDFPLQITESTGEG